MRTLVTAAVFLALPFLMGFVSPKLGQPAPAFAVRDSGGQMVTLADYDDRVVVLEWSDPACPEASRYYTDGSMTKLQQWATEHGVIWLSVISSIERTDRQRQVPPAKTLTQQQLMDAKTLLLDEAGTMARAYDVDMVPRFFIIGIDGKLAFSGGMVAQGEPDAAALDPGPSVRMLHEALESVVANNPPEVEAVDLRGCEISY